MEDRQRMPTFDFDGEYGQMYDELVRRVIPGYEDSFIAAAALLEERVSPAASILIVGPGTGQELRAFAPMMASWRFMAVDPVPEMIDATLAVAGALGISERVDHLVGEVQDLPSESSFDAATIINVLHFLPDDGSKAQLLSSVLGRLKPGAPVVLFDLFGDPDSPRYCALRDVWRMYQTLNGLSAHEVSDFNTRLDREMHFVPRERLEDLWEGVGFRAELMYWNTLLYGGWLLRSEGGAA